MMQEEVPEEVPAGGARGLWQSRWARLVRWGRTPTLPLAVGAILLLIALAECLLLGAYLGNLSNSYITDTLSLSYSDFQAQVTSGNVAWVMLEDGTGTIDAGLRHPISARTVQGKTSTSDRVTTIYPYNDTANLRTELKAHGVAIVTAPPDAGANDPAPFLVAALICGSAAMAGILGAGSLLLGTLRLAAQRRATI